jgi:hypothetical protein
MKWSEGHKVFTVILSISSVLILKFLTIYSGKKQVKH